MKYKVEIFTPNKFFIIKGRPVRSPFETIATESELKMFKMKIKADGILDYNISPLYDDFSFLDQEEVKSENIVAPPKLKNNFDKIQVKDLSSETEVKIEELEVKSKTLLDKFLYDDVEPN